MDQFKTVEDINKTSNQTWPCYLLNGTRLSNRYKIENHLKSGGFGNTYLAIDERFNAYVAIKELFLADICGRAKNSASVIIPLESNQNTFQSHKERFLKEANRLFKFSHPNIMKVTDVFEDNNTAYYVMEYVDGVSLQEYIKKYGPLTEERLLPYLDQILSALDYIHSKGVLHLDLKPGNIMLDNAGRIVLIDFGTSKQFESTNDNVQSSSLSGGAYTIGYAPPEYIGLTNDKVGTYSDIYSLGVTIYNLLTSTNPPSPIDIHENGLPKINNISTPLKESIVKATKYFKKDRIKDVTDFKNCLKKSTPFYKNYLFYIFIVIIFAISYILFFSKEKNIDSIHNNLDTTLISPLNEKEIVKNSDINIPITAITTDMALCDVKGPVKSINNIGYSIFEGLSVHFDEDGYISDISDCRIKRVKGSIETLYLKDSEDPESGEISIEIKYSDNKPYVITYSLDDCDIKETLTFNEDNLLSEIKTIKSYSYNPMVENSEEFYKYTEVDKYGNWLTREHHYGDIIDIQTRAIQYYKQ